MEDHSKKICETCHFHLTNITGSKIKTYLDHESIEAIIDAFVTTNPGLEITAGQWTMSGLIVDLTGQTFVWPVMLTRQNSIVLKMK